MERKKFWAREHPKSRPSDWHKQKSAIIERGKVINTNEQQSLSWMADSDPDLEWIIRVAIPFSWAASKNHIYAMRAKGHVWLRDEARTFRTQLALLLKSAMRNQVIVQNKLWLDILIQKPNQRGDAVNFLDVISDAIKDAVGIDDRWFSIRRLDWQIVKVDPRIFIGIGQEKVEASQACSHCGRILPYSSFTKNRSAASGYTRSCKECLKKNPNGETPRPTVDGEPVPIAYDVDPEG